jgi:RNA polymerase sigma-70 factor (ECF subfamily)
LEESALIDLAAQQDEQAWEALIAAHQQAVFRLAYLFTGDSDEAEDVTQEVFVRAFRFLDRYDRARPFRPWLLSITANLARNRLRSFKRYLAALQNFARRDPGALTQSGPDQKAIEEGRNLWQVVRKLSYEDQKVIYLRYFLELSESETAAALNIPRGTVKSRLSRSLGRLRDRLAQEEDEILRSLSHD